MPSASIRYMKAGETYATLVSGGTDSANLQSAINSIGSSSGEIFIGPGTLTLTAGFSVSAASEIRIRGAGKGITTLVGTGSISNTVTCSAEFQYLTFDTWSRCIDFSGVTGTISRLAFKDCEMKNAVRGIYGDNISAPGLGVDRFLAENCDVTNMTSYGIFVNTYVIGRSEVINCKVKTFFDRGISFGNNTVALEDIRGPYLIRGNHVEDGLNASASAVEGIICHGWRAIITNNEVRNIRRTVPTESDCEGIYTKCRYSVIADNLLVDAGQGEAMINLKGGARNETVVQPYGFSVICANNQCVDTQTNPTSGGGGKATSGIKIATSECLVIGNEISGMTVAGIYDDSDNGADTPNHNILVTNNIVKDSRGNYGIAMFGRGNNVRVVNNLVDTVLRTYDASGQSYGIYVTKKAGTGLDVSDNRVKNIVDYGQTPVGISLNPSRLNLTVTADPATDAFTTSFAHTLLVNDQVKFSNSGGGLPAPLVAGTIYFIKAVPTTATFTVAATLGGATIDITTAGTGTHTVNKMTTHTNWAILNNNIDTATWGVQFTWDETYTSVDGVKEGGQSGRNINGNVIPVPGDLSKYSDFPTNLELGLFQEAAHDWALRSTTNPQELRLYGTWTDSTNYERLLIQTTASTTRVVSEAGSGGGTARPLEWGVGSNKWRVTGSGHIEAMTDATFDFGPAGASPRDIQNTRDLHLGRKLYMDYTNTGTVGNVTMNKPSGRVNCGAGSAALTVTNNLVTAASHVIAVAAQNDATGWVKNVVTAAGSFVINMGANPTANQAIDFVVFNAD